MADDPAFMLRDQRQYQIAVGAQPIDERGFRRADECAFVDRADSGNVSGHFGAHGNHASRVPDGSGVPRRNSSACIGCLPAR